MMKDTMTRLTVYPVWEYKKEEEALNKASAEGRQLVKGGCFHSVFRKDDSVRYIYQLDYCPTPDSKERYIECFNDAGWEFVNSTYNGWHYFRRPYTQDLAPEDLKIYSDKESLYAMENRWLGMITTFSVIYFIFSIIEFVCFLLSASNSMDYEQLFMCGFMFVMGITFFLGARSIKRSRAGKKPGFIPPFQIIFPIAILGLLLMAFL
ncbi:MAG: DUF2812 domain-containing protein [Clostridia bacterium]|nr:DUF2812 domain-containing protein [Lachnospiraceae bacterium]NCB99348.1 DUF2812 domain-containing protein [Clostridia bacterium]NCD01549.1 DUF2812 domain-containing protein [Clostridia bacterium]